MSKKKKEDTSNQPWVSNYPPLKDWLDKHNARCMWQWPFGERPSDLDEAYEWAPPAYVECWAVGKGSILIVVYGHKYGWEIYSALGTNKIAETLADAEKRCGITS